jgi:chemotaxis protein CheD
MESIIKVRMADFATCSVPQKITTIGLGSCVGIVLYDTVTKKCGMLHAMLPDSTRIRNNANRAKFVDTGLDDMLHQMLREGAVQNRMIAKMAGGAKMFDFTEESDVTSIGYQNVQAARLKLKSLGIALVSEDTGEKYGRTICFDPAINELEVKAVGHEVKFI